MPPLLRFLPCAAVLAWLNCASAQDGLLAFVVEKNESLVQTSEGLAPYGPTPYLFEAVIADPLGLLTGASVTPPGGPARSLVRPPAGDAFVFSSSHSSETGLNAAFPDGLYVANLEGFGTTLQISMPPGGYPNPPEISNFHEVQAVPADANFQLRWTPISGTGVLDSITLALYDGDQLVFRSDANPASAADVSAVIPANTLAAGRNYQGILLFHRVTNYDPGALGLMPASAARSRATWFTLTTRPELRLIVLSSPGDPEFEFRFFAAAGLTYEIQISSDLEHWSMVEVLAGTNNWVYHADTEWPRPPRRFYRVRTR